MRILQNENVAARELVAESDSNGGRVQHRDIVPQRHERERDPCGEDAKGNESDSGIQVVLPPAKKSRSEETVPEPQNLALNKSEGLASNVLSEKTTLALPTQTLASPPSAITKTLPPPLSATTRTLPPPLSAISGFQLCLKTLKVNIRNTKTRTESSHFPVTVQGGKRAPRYTMKAVVYRPPKEKQKFAVALYAVRGEEDSKLHWPLEGEVMVEVSSSHNEPLQRTFSGTWNQITKAWQMYGDGQKLKEESWFTQEELERHSKNGLVNFSLYFRVDK